MRTTLVAIACALAGGAAFAQTGVGVGVRVGTLGVGLDVSRAVTDTVNVRGTANFFNMDRSLSESDVDYDAKLKLNTFGALADWHPWQGGFRLSAGAYANRNKLDMQARPSAGSTINLGGTTFALGTQVESANARVKFKSFAPYLGIGWGNAAQKVAGWSLVADVGVLYQQTPRTTLNAVCGPAAVGTPVCDEIQARAAQEQADLQDSLRDFKWYPVVSIGAAYRF